MWARVMARVGLGVWPRWLGLGLGLWLGLG